MSHLVFITLFGETNGVKLSRLKCTLIIPISVCFYSDLHDATTSNLGAQFLLTKVQHVVETL